MEKISAMLMMIDSGQLSEDDHGLVLFRTVLPFPERSRLKSAIAASQAS